MECCIMSAELLLKHGAQTWLVFALLRVVKTMLYVPLLIIRAKNNEKMTTIVPESSAEVPPLLGLAIVGCGQIVTHHIQAMASELSGRLELRALCDPSQGRRDIIQDLVIANYAHELLPQNNKPRHFETLNNLLADNENEYCATQIDIIFIAVPHDLHKQLALQALSSGKIVVMEKPLAPTRYACDRLVQASQDLLHKSNSGDATEKKPSMLIIAEQSPYWQEVALARSIISESDNDLSSTNAVGVGGIGHVVTAASYYYESMRDNITSGSVEESGGLGWRGSIQRAGGGIALDGGLHWIRSLREMLGRRIVKVVAVVRRNLVPELKLEGESVAHALFEMEDASTITEPEGAGPLVATYSCNLLATAPMAHDTCPYFRITGTKGELVIHGDGLFKEKPGAGGLRLYNNNHPQGIELFPNDRKGGFFLGFAGLWKEIYRIGSTCDYAAAHESVVRASDDVGVVLAMYKSAKSGQWEAVR